MKILNLRFKNLNSLYGEWEIDFTANEYISDGIFAVTGPTGSGKSTILDAICLALYGRTPRLSKVNNSGNEIMSRQTGECFAEVTFETMSGKYRCHWSQHRARKKAEGKLATATHELSNAETGGVIAAKKKDVDKEVEKATGMDFERFTRSMLLAQGGFAAFLQAKPDERAPILEQMTGTEIYTDISKTVHERHIEERGKLDMLKAEISGINTLTEEQETELIAGLQQKQSEEENLAKAEQKILASIQWLNNISALQEELSAIKLELEESKKQLTAFTPDREILKKAQKAAEIESIYVALKLTREAQEKDKSSLAESEKSKPSIEEKLKQKNVELQQETNNLAALKKAQNEEHKLTKQVRELDTKVLFKRDELKSIARELQDIEKNISSQQTILEQTKKQKKAIESKAEAATNYLIENKNDGQLQSALTGINEQIKNLQTSIQKVSSATSSHNSANELLKSTTAAYEKKLKACKALKTKYDSAAKDAVAIEKFIKKLLNGKPLREYREKQTALMQEKSRIDTINILEERRKELEDGKDCPLCGSRHHPYAEGNIPAIGETEKQINTIATLIRNIEDEEAKLKEAETREKSAKDKLTESNNELVELKSRKDRAEAELNRLKLELDSAIELNNQTHDSILEKLKQFGITQLPLKSPTTIYNTLKIRSDKWVEQNSISTNARTDSDKLDAEIGSACSIIEMHNESFNSKKAIHTALTTELGKYTSQRKKLYGDKNPDSEEKLITENIYAKEENIISLTEERDCIAHQITELKSRIDSLKTNIEKRASELTNAENLFITRCKTVGFNDEQTFKSCLLQQDAKEKLIQKEKELDSNKADIETRKKDRKDRLESLTKQNITKESTDKLDDAKTDIQSQLSNLRETIGAAKEKLESNAKAKESCKEKQDQINLQSKECIKWDNLHSLIGSADGKKYRNFAQGLTFEIMVSHANRQLSKMSNRYLLIRDKDQPLELNVIDNYQAGEIRSTKNLSGGESFIISLSLALGLSKMASRKVRVDSLFLDEGFGTLDEEALDIALNTLAALQQDGKLIGVISHVATLKERITTQINIIPSSGGRSYISGPGCKTVTPN